MNNSPSLIDRLLNIGILAGLGVGGYFFLSAQMKKAALQNAEGNLGKSVEGQQALALRSAFNPSGWSWLMGGDGTNNKAIFDIAGKIRDFKVVAQAYRDLYNSDLSTDLTNELKAEEAAKFFSIVNSKGHVPGSTLNTKQGFVDLYLKPIALKAQIKKRLFVQSVIMLDKVQKFIPITKGVAGTPVIMNYVKTGEGNYWVINKQLNLN